MLYKLMSSGTSMNPNKDRSVPPSLSLSLSLSVFININLLVLCPDGDDLMLCIFFNNLQYDFSGRNDIVRFIKEVQAQGLYVALRIGPFIESEWSYG